MIKLPNREEELEQFKKNINFIHFASEQYGYSVLEDQTLDGGSCVVLRKEKGDKIIVVESAKTGHWIYFHVGDDADRGTIIDFVKFREPTKNIGHIRVMLRPWCNISLPDDLKRFKKLKSSGFMRKSVIYKYNGMKEEFPVFLRSRGLSEDLIKSSIFSTKILSDDYGNAIFPHWDDHGICGYEIKNNDKSLFCKNGKRTYWSSNNVDSHDVFISESAIDCLSFAQLYPNKEYFYISVGGAVSGVQQVTLKNHLKNKLSIYIGVDNDESGDNYVELFKELFGDQKIIDCRPPKKYSDWNDVLKFENMEHC
jgi:hypothetical protein